MRFGQTLNLHQQRGSSIEEVKLLLDTYPGAVAGYQLGSADLLSRHGGALTAYILHL
jgi:hypothetical protein